LFEVRDVRHLWKASFQGGNGRANADRRNVPYHGPPRTLGQRRLSIIDLSRSATAPLSNEDETIWTVLNGEISNFQELRLELINKGHIFRTGTDTEVILHLYEELGTNCLLRLRGMYAFALWDSGKKTIFAVRDRLGKKPFLYSKTADSLVFGSEIKAITVNPDVSSRRVSFNRGTKSLLNHLLISISKPERR
jgi:asparagine synthase (glutamine-hydrolysing)